MQIKLFNGTVGGLTKLETRVNEWLKANPKVIVRVVDISNVGLSDLVIAITYTEVAKC